MSMTLYPSLSSQTPSLKLPLHKTTFSRLNFRPHNQIIPFTPSPIKLQSLLHECNHNFPGFLRERTRILLSKRLGIVSATSGNGVDEEAENEGRGPSTMPERFRYLTKEAPDPTVKWPFFVALAFILYAWRAVLFELSNWRKGVFGIFRFMGYLSKLVVALLFHFIGDPITSLIKGVETLIYTIRSFYSSIVAYTPVPELTMIIILASVVLSVAEATKPNAINSQPYLLTLSGVIGYTAVRGYISEPFFWTLLLGLYGFSKFVKKRDDVSSTMPVAAVLAAIGEPWVRVLTLASYLALAISEYSKKCLDEKEDVEIEVMDRRLPLPLLGAALAIGIHAAAKWAGYRHLTWMVV